MSDGIGGEPHAPSAYLAGVGTGRWGRAKGVVILERNDGDAWREIGRFGSVPEADRALDEATANGASPDSLRVVETSTASHRLLLFAGAVAIGVAIAIVAYVVFG
jgi:hypothetical protein